MKAAELRPLDQICDKFEQQWKSRNPGRIEDALPLIDERLRPILLEELVRVELEWRLYLGEQLPADEYSRRFPSLSSSLADLLQAAHSAVSERSLATASPGETLPHIPSAIPNDYSTRDFPPRVAPDLPPQHQLGEYDLYELLGVGGMGEVWKARHRRLGKLVALKLIRSDGRQSTETVQRFLREMQAIGQLDHPHVVEASDAGESDGTVYLAMKLVEGQTLTQYVHARGPLPVADACDLIRQIALGLHYLDRRGLVHRDLKPSNVMRTPDGQIKILDLGLARWQLAQQPAEMDHTQPGQGLGTPDYMAPEQIVHAAAVDIRADLYALGATFYYLLAGKPPFGDIAGAFEKLKAHESQPAPDIRTLRPDIPPALAQLIASLLAKNPNARPANPDAVLQALSQMPLMEGATLPQIVMPPTRRGWRQRRLRLVAAAVVLLGLGALIWTLTQLRERERNLPLPGGASPLVQTPPIDEGRLTVKQFDVFHAQLVENGAKEKGIFGIDTFVAHLGDQVKVSVPLSRAGYGYLLAYAANGQEFLLDPPNETDVPKSVRELRYPMAGQPVEYALNDGVGQHLFVAVLSDAPLPSYNKWCEQNGRAPWKSIGNRERAVWRQVGGDLHAATPWNPDVRGKDAVPLGLSPVEGLLDWWKKRPGIVDIGLTGFSVLD